MIYRIECAENTLSCVLVFENGEQYDSLYT